MKGEKMNNDRIRIGANVFGALTGNWLGIIIAIYAEERCGVQMIRIADDAITCRNARDIAVNGYLVI